MNSQFLNTFFIMGVFSTGYYLLACLFSDAQVEDLAHVAVLTLVLYLYARDKVVHKHMALHQLSETALLMYHRMNNVGDIYEFPRKYLDEAKELEKMGLAERQISTSNTIYLKRTR